MNTTLSTVRGRAVQHPPPATVALPQRAVRRVRLLDRVAMRLGLALLTWGRRRSAIDLRQQRIARADSERNRELRERSAEREYRLLVPPR